jgi:undecaprenyl-diphosphatase
MKTPICALIMALLLGVPSAPTLAAGGPLGIDQRVAFDESGIWARHNQLALEYGSIAIVGALALWEGSESRLGKTSWQAVDSMALGAIASTGLKLTFSRVRPVDSANPNQWFQGSGNKSFPSGEVTLISSVVTPYILEYGPDHPGVYALALLPVYDGIARMKSRGHWQTDVLAGVALGATMGYLMHERDVPLVLGVLPQGFSVGFNKRW